MAAQKNPQVRKHLLMARQALGILQSSLSLSIEAATWEPWFQQSFVAEGALGLWKSYLLC